MNLAHQVHIDQGNQSLTDTGIFLVGAERSGTTMLRLMLNHHPKIAWANEFEYAVDRVSDNGERPSINEYNSWLAEHRIFAATGFEIDHSASYDQLVHSFLLQTGDRDTKPIVGATVHRHFDRLLHIWPDAKFIHLVRDPRDVAPSVMKMGWAGTLYHACARWINAEHDWDRLTKIVPPERRLSIRFEDLLADPEGVLSNICALIGISFDESMLAYHHDTSYEPADPSASQRWKKSLKPREIGLIEGRVGELLNSRGYETSPHQPIQPGVLARSMLGIHDRFFRARFRIRRYGFWLWLMALVTRRLSPNGTYVQINRKTIAIDREHLR